MKVSDFDYSFPKEIIAQKPSEKRDHSRLMILDRKTKAIEHKLFYQVSDYLNPGDLLVLNDTKVIPANIVGVKDGGNARIEVLLVKRIDVEEAFRPPYFGDLKVAATSNLESRQVWECLVKPGKRLSVGSKVIFGNGEVIGKVLEKLESGEQIIEFDGDIEGFMRRKGEIPLPPYINSSIIPRPSSLVNRYQTVYAQKEGASAAPTAGLHFTQELLDKIKEKGINIAYVTLHTGLATFKPVYAENVEEHKMYEEYFEVPVETIKAVREAKRVIAVGTTSVRTLETISVRFPDHPISRSPIPDHPITGSTNLFIYPGYEFKIVDAIITNFHFPKSTLLMLVSAFAGKDLIFNAYEEALNDEYRFFSFGDAMLIV
jgi:S-adenosylmethionine:tRNA ribosyltransferase-isomerase